VNHPGKKTKTASGLHYNFHITPGRSFGDLAEPLWTEQIPHRLTMSSPMACKNPNPPIIHFPINVMESELPMYRGVTRRMVVHVGSLVLPYQDTGLGFGLFRIVLPLALLAPVKVAAPLRAPWGFSWVALSPSRPI